MQRILLIDNYDSFVHNLGRYLQRLGQLTTVRRNDVVDANIIRDIAPSALVFSPGPCTPHVAGNSRNLVEQFHTKLPMLGVCLGHQTLAVAFGASLRRAPEPMHGRTSQVYHDGRGVFTDLENPICVCRYHSLVVDEATLPDCFQVSARTHEGLIMAIRHRELPLVGLQFHPESILTTVGYRLLAGFLRLAGLPVVAPLPRIEDEMVSSRSAKATYKSQYPVTF